MAQFAKSTFSAASYAAFRPTYPASLYERVLAFHQGPRKLCIDLGCGHGPVARHLAGFFDSVIGVDPSKGMIAEAQSINSGANCHNIRFVDGSAEELPFVGDETVDLVVAGQAAHWFDTSRLWPELKRTVRRKGTIAFFGYKDHVFIDYPHATKVLDEYAYGTTSQTLGPYWSQPGRSKVQDKLRSLQPPEAEWEEITRLEYEPEPNTPEASKANMFLSKKMTIANCMRYVRTWSAFSAWQDAHPDRLAVDQGGKGDLVDEMFEAMKALEGDWASNPDWKSKEVNVEWGSALILARKR